MPVKDHPASRMRSDLLLALGLRGPERETLPRTSVAYVAINLLVITLIALGCAVAAGEYSPYGIAALLLAAGIAVTAVVVSPHRVSDWAARWAWPGTVGVCAGMNLMPALAPRDAVLALAATALLLASVLYLSTRPLEGWGWVAAATGVVGDLMLVVGKVTWGRAGIDVFWFTQGAAGQLLKGHDPYGASFPTTTPHLATAHFPFGPTAVLLAAPFHLVGDVRLASVCAVGLTLWTVSVLGRRHGGPRHAGRCLALAMALPFVATMIAGDWPEVFPVAALGLWLVGRDRHRNLSATALGIGLAAVPTVAPLLMFPWLWWRSARMEISASVGVAIVLAAPFAAWAGPGNFISDTVGVQVRLGPRVDGLGLNGLLWHAHWGWLPWWVGIGSALTFVVVANFVAPRSWATALALGATLALVAFLTAKWAFFNYYYIASLGLVLSVALTGVEQDERRGGSDPVWRSKGERGLRVVG